MVIGNGTFCYGKKAAKAESQDVFGTAAAAAAAAGGRGGGGVRIAIANLLSRYNGHFQSVDPRMQRITLCFARVVRSGFVLVDVGFGT